MAEVTDAVALRLAKADVKLLKEKLHETRQDCESLRKLVKYCRMSEELLQNKLDTERRQNYYWTIAVCVMAFVSLVLLFWDTFGG